MESNDCKLIIVLVTSPQGRGVEIARRLLEERLAACVNIVSATSLYWWENKINKDAEDLLIIKSKKDCENKLMRRIRELHPYEVPEIVVLDTEKVLESYLAWACGEASCPEKSA